MGQVEVASYCERASDYSLMMPEKDPSVLSTGSFIRILMALEEV